MAGGVCEDEHGVRGECDGGGEGGDGEAGEGEGGDGCGSHCDCPQGQICLQGQCMEGASPKYCCDAGGCPNDQACYSAAGVEGCCDGGAVGSCEGGGGGPPGGGGGCQADCTCGGETPYCMVDTNNPAASGTCRADGNDQGAVIRVRCCEDNSCANANGDDAAYNQMCQSRQAGMGGRGCCGVDDNDCMNGMGR